MNRWTYFLIGQRFKAVGNEKYKRRKTLSKLIINTILLILSLIFLILTIIYGGIGAIIAGSLFFGGILGFMTSMSVGKDMIFIQFMIVKEQLRADRPIDFDGRRVKIGFLLSFVPIYLMILVSTLIPGGYLFLIPYIPLCFTAIILAYLSSGFIETFNYKMSKYIWCHIGAQMFCIIVGSVIRECLIAPSIK